MLAGPPSASASAALGSADRRVEDEVARYVSQIVFLLRAGTPTAELDTERDVPDRVFEALIHRRFCALSRGRARRYREGVLGALAGAFRRGEPLEFWYDIGPGYHASLRPESHPVSFEVGLGELLLLAQVAAFMRKVGALYPPGARFQLVVDNLCGLRTNAIPVEHTEGYCARLRGLIDELGLADGVRLFVESEACDLGKYDSMLREVPAPPLPLQVSQAEIDNVARFLGRRCTRAEALERMQLYQQTSQVTERLLGEVVRGPRLTQRATAGTLGFRSFPGGDARIQCGEVGVGRGFDGDTAPLLLTSRNIDLYECAWLRCACPPSSIKHVLVASRRA